MTQWLSAGQEVLVPSLPSLVSQTLTPSELKVVLHMQRWLRCSATRIRKTCWASSVLWKPPLLESKFFSGNPWLKEKALESYQRGIKFSTISDHDSSRSHPKSYKRSWGSLLCYWFHRYSLKLNARCATRRNSYWRQSLQQVQKGRKLYRKEEIPDKEGYNFIHQPKPRRSPPIVSRLFFPGLSKSPHLQHRFLQELLHQVFSYSSSHPLLPSSEGKGMFGIYNPGWM